MPLFDTTVIVDWSARSKPSPRRPTKDSIWWCAARREGDAVQAEAPAVRVVTHEEKGWRIAFVAVTSKLNMGLKGAPPHVPFVETKELAARLAGPEGPIARAREDHDLDL